MISCLGLIGLSAFSITQRTKEIGIRKVLGSSVSGIVQLLTKDFLILIFIAFVVAVPAAWFASTRWLESFAYKIDVSWWVFLLAAAIVFLTAFATISFQTIKAACANPVNSLRSE
jgi:putative ABC transport system permease protein